MNKSRLMARAGAAALAACMLAMPAVPAHAVSVGEVIEDDLPTVDVPIGGKSKVNITVDGVAKKYGAYKLLDLSASLRKNCGHNEGETHVHDCFNYNYTVNPDYADALKAAATEMGFDWDANKDGTVSDAEIRNGLGDMTAKQTRDYADALYMGIKDREPDVTTTTKQFEKADQGWYLIAELEKGDSPDAVSLVMLDTAGLQDITVNAKEGVPELTKKILVEDPSQPDGYRRVDALDVAVGDIVPFEISVTVPANVEDFEHYNFTIHDKSQGLKLTEDQPEIFVDGNKAFYRSAGGEVEFTTGTDGCLFELPVDMEGNALYDMAGNQIKFEADTVITLRYKAILAEDYTTAFTGNPNEAHAEFSSNPYDPDDKEETPKDKVAVFTYKFVTDKVNDMGQPLAGAEFTLFKEVNGKWVEVPELEGEGAEGDKTSFMFSGLDAGNYKLSETKVPDGYIGVEDIEFEIRAEYDEETEEPSVKSLSVWVDGKCVSEGENPSFGVELEDGKTDTDVMNTKGVRLPSTGEVGRYMLLFAGVGAVIAGVIYLEKTKKRED